MSSARYQLVQTAADLGAAPTSLQIVKALKVFDSLDAQAAGLVPVRIGVVSSFTFDMLLRPLIARAYCDGYRLSVCNAPYGQYVQELVNPESGLHKFAPEVVLLALRLQDLRPELYDRFNSLTQKQVDSIVREAVDELGQLLETFRKLSKARILCTNFELPAYPSLGLADRSVSPSQTAVISHLNDALSEAADRIGNCQLVDIDALAARCGRERWIDPKMQLWARSPIRADFHWAYAGEVVRVLRATSGRARKVLALDCDNTIWGGVLGDVGIDGIALGHDYPGSAYVALQKRVLELFHRGVVLVIASKNDNQAVKEVFELHTEMVLRPEHISYFAVNWDPKPENLWRAAAALNLGLDSFVFLDDHPVECAMMRELQPDVWTVQLPEDPAEFELVIARLDCFDQLTVSQEDRARGAMYRQEIAREEFRGQAGDLDSFYVGLKMQMRFGVNCSAHVARAAQLTQRTNQFNMTTVRRAESEIASLMRSGDHEVITLGLSDRFGDHGIVGLAIVQKAGNQWILESFLMSCRVLGRTVEQTFLAWIGIRAMHGGAARIVGLYSPTRKNASFENFYASCGMHRDPVAPDGPARFILPLEPESAALTIPSWMTITLFDEKGMAG